MNRGNNMSSCEQWINENKQLEYKLKNSEEEQARSKSKLMIANAENRWLRQVCMALTATSFILAVIIRFVM